jgi:hypothetical protein
MVTGVGVAIMTLEVDIAQTDVSFVEFCFGVLQVPLYIL